MFEHLLGNTYHATVQIIVVSRIEDIQMIPISTTQWFALEAKDIIVAREEYWTSATRGDGGGI